MARISVGEAKQWLEETKLDITVLDTELERSVSTMVLAKTSGTYDVSGWTSPATTPALIRKIISMLYASWFYNRQYSEESEAESWYARRLAESAYMLMEGVSAGTVLLPDVDSATGAYGNPVFYPTDDQESDGLGEEIKFRIGSVF